MRRPSSAAGGGTGLVVAGVHAAGVRVDHLRQLVGVGTAQLGQAAVLQDHPRQLVLLGNRLQRLFIGAGLALGGLHHRRQLQLIEQHRLQLLGRIQVEAAPGQLGGLLLRGQHARGQVLALPAQFVGVDPHAIGFDAGQHRHQRHLDVAVHAVQRRLGQQLRLQRVVQAQGDVGVLGRIAAGFVDAHLRERNLLGALAGHVLELDGAVAQVAQGQRVHVVAGGGGIEHEALEHGVVVVALHVHAVAAQHMQVVLAVLAQLLLRRVLQHRAQRVQHLLHRQLRRRPRVVVADRNVGGPARLDGQTDTDQARTHRVQRIGLGIEADQVGLLQALDPGLQLLAGQHRLVFTGRGQRRVQRAGGRRFGAATGEAGGGTAQARGGLTGSGGRRQRCSQFL
ncbi:hypothetical protein G6F50_013189 [Rhizopus delemar]|uniref:Uncharacterized protein n=1 Tax=Rhizopus delemar TaxID=936053 RepID=A0A9P7CG71_9FUNG|nr:hypothetical protein G6F50_013189 [Rhizopus delemar]